VRQRTESLKDMHATSTTCPAMRPSVPERNVIVVVAVERPGHHRAALGVFNQIAYAILPVREPKSQAEATGDGP
jgi:hypothetical protein